MNKRWITLGTIIVSAAFARLLPHPPNVTPIAAVALFGGAYLSNQKVAFVLPLGAMFLSDLALWALGEVSSPGPQLLGVYVSFSLTVCIGFLLRRHHRALPIAAATLASAVLFYLVANFGVWATSGWYPPTMTGLLECYVAAIPFLRNMLLGNACYVALLFGGFALAERKFLVVREPDSIQPKIFSRAV